MSGVAMAGSGELVGYWGFPCPHGSSLHLAAMYISTSMERFEMIEGPPFGPETKTRVCPDCLSIGTDKKISD